jgi:hypothetical protein
MDLLSWSSTSELQAVPSAARAALQVRLLRGHAGTKRPYSVPFTYSISADDKLLWEAWVDFDQLYVKGPYSGPQLLARFCENLRRLAEGEESVQGDSAHDRATWQAMVTACFRPDDIYQLSPPEDMSSRRSEFTRKTLAELADANPSEFHSYEIQTVSGANSNRSDMRSEFRIISRPEARHRWMFWTHAPERISNDAAELYYWFTRHVAQLRGDRRPRWTVAQRERWFAHVHRELIGKSAAELKLDALAATPEQKPNLGLMLGIEKAAGGVRRWVIPRASFANAIWQGENLEIAFTDADDWMPKVVILIFRSVAMARQCVAEILSGERRRLGVGALLRGIIARPANDEFIVLVGLTESEEKEQITAYIERHGPGISQSRNGLLLQLHAPHRFQ